MGGGTILRSSFLLLSSICSRLPHLRVVGAIRLHSTQGQRPAIVTMPNDLIARLRCSPTLGKPSALDKDWFNLRTRPSPMPRADNRVSATPRPRRASLSLVLRETEEGKVEMLVIKRAANPRRDLDVWCLYILLIAFFWTDLHTALCSEGGISRFWLETWYPSVRSLAPASEPFVVARNVCYVYIYLRVWYLKSYLVSHQMFCSCGSLPPSKAFSRGFSAGVRPGLGCSGRRCGSARAAPHALARGLDVGVFDGYLHNLRGFPALSAI